MNTKHISSSSLSLVNQRTKEEDISVFFFDRLALKVIREDDIPIFFS
jgi:hypothetical protein